MKEETKDLPKELQEPVNKIGMHLERRSQGTEIMLPWWSEAKRGVPNTFLRSALFSAVQGKDRKVMKRQQILASQDGINVRFTGEQLNQTDLNVWEAIVQLVHPYPLGTISHFSSYQILKTLDLSLGSTQYRYLHEAIIRLAAGLIQINNKGMRRGYFGHLIEWGFTEQDTDPLKEPPEFYEIHLNRHLIKLFGQNDWTALDWEQRRQLRSKPLASGIHALYSSHRDPFPMKVQTLHSLVGSGNKEMRDFKFKLKKALDELKGIGFLAGYAIEDELVHVCRSSLTIEGKGLKLL